ncbi:MAG: aa3-type cytochrome c oxidase subunit IV [Alphaproteobacteria bacterium]
MAANFDIKPHARMWHDFTRLMTYSAGGVILCLILLALFVL